MGPGDLWGAPPWWARPFDYPLYPPGGTPIPGGIVGRYVPPSLMEPYGPAGFVALLAQQAAAAAAAAAQAAAAAAAEALGAAGGSAEPGAPTDGGTTEGGGASAPSPGTGWTTPTTPSSGGTAVPSAPSRGRVTISGVGGTGPAGGGWAGPTSGGWVGDAWGAQTEAGWPGYPTGSPSAEWPPTPELYYPPYGAGPQETGYGTTASTMASTAAGMPTTPAGPGLYAVPTGTPGGLHVSPSPAGQAERTGAGRLLNPSTLTASLVLLQEEPEEPGSERLKDLYEKIKETIEDWRKRGEPGSQVPEIPDVWDKLKDYFKLVTDAQQQAGVYDKLHHIFLAHAECTPVMQNTAIGDLAQWVIAHTPHGQQLVRDTGSAATAAEIVAAGLRAVVLLVPKDKANDGAIPRAIAERFKRLREAAHRRMLSEAPPPQRESDEDRRWRQYWERRHEWYRRDRLHREEGAPPPPPVILEPDAAPPEVNPTPQARLAAILGYREWLETQKRNEDAYQRALDAWSRGKDPGQLPYRPSRHPDPHRRF